VVNTKLSGLLISAVGGDKMRHHLIMGIVDIVVGLALFILCIVLNRTERIVLTFFPVAVGVGLIASYISNRKQTCWRNPTKKEMAKIAGTNLRVNRKCCENCAYVEFEVIRGSQTINKICNYNPVRPIIGNHGRHVCSNWCPGAGCVVLKIEE
jgi:hypothetical protein